MSKTTLVYTTYIRTTPQKVWDALINPELTKQYWGGMVNVSDWNKGSKWEHHNTKSNNEVALVGEVLECEPPKRLVLSWSSPNGSSNVSSVIFEIISVEGVVRLDLIHADLELDSEMYDGVSKGWPLVLSNMKTHLEGGEAMDIMAIMKKGCGKAA